MGIFNAFPQFCCVIPCSVGFLVFLLPTFLLKLRHRNAMQASSFATQREEIMTGSESMTVK